MLRTKAGRPRTLNASKLRASRSAKGRPPRRARPFARRMVLSRSARAIQQTGVALKTSKAFDRRAAKAGPARLDPFSLDPVRYGRRCIGVFLTTLIES